MHPLTPEKEALFEAQILCRRSEGARLLGVSRRLELRVYGHILRVPRAVFGRRVACFAFQDLCGEALGAADFLDLADSFRVVFLSHVPKLDLTMRNEVRFYPQFI